MTLRSMPRYATVRIAPRASEATPPALAYALLCSLVPVASELMKVYVIHPMSGR